jgi:hypothetical protein
MSLKRFQKNKKMYERTISKGLEIPGELFLRYSGLDIYLANPKGCFGCHGKDGLFKLIEQAEQDGPQIAIPNGKKLKTEDKTLNLLDVGYSCEVEEGVAVLTDPASEYYMDASDKLNLLKKSHPELFKGCPSLVPLVLKLRRELKPEMIRYFPSVTGIDGHDLMNLAEKGVEE